MSGHCGCWELITGKCLLTLKGPPEAEIIPWDAQGFRYRIGVLILVWDCRPRQLSTAQWEAERWETL